MYLYIDIYIYIAIIKYICERVVWQTRNICINHWQISVKTAAPGVFARPTTS